MTPQPPHTPSGDGPLVSVVMPAFKPQYLDAALSSLAAQTHREIELVVCDDNPGKSVRRRIEAFAATAPFPVRYHHNPERLRESRNGARGVALAQGHYIKFLYDDDVLRPDCIAAQVAVLHARPEVALVTSRRRRIDSAGDVLPDTLHTAPIFAQDVRIDGRALIRFLGQHTYNFIGEPSAVMCRRADLLGFGERLMDLDGRPIQWYGDLALYAKLLQKGDLAYLAEPLSDFRVSVVQFSQIGRERPGIGNRGLDAFREALFALGWSEEGDRREVPVAPLDGSAPALDFDLLDALAQAEARGRVHGQLDHWQRQRQLDPAQWKQAQDYLDAHARPTLAVVLDARGRDTAALEATLGSLAPQRPLYAALDVYVLGGPSRPADMADGVRALQTGAGLAAVLNDLLARPGMGDWLVVANAGDIFCSGALQRLPLALAEATALRAVFADEWHRGAGFAPPSPVLRPDFDLDLLLGHPAAMAPHWIFGRAALAAAGGFDPAREDNPLALALDAIVRLVEHGGSQDLAHLPEPLLYCDPPRGDDVMEAGVIVAHLRRRGHAGAEVNCVGPGLHRLAYRHARATKVSMLLVADATTAPALLQRCLVSLLEKTAYPDHEILLVDNGVAAATTQWLQQVAALASPRLRLFALDAPLPHSAAANLAATQASGEFLLFLRPEVAFVQPQWLDALLEQGLRPDVGITGARTVSADGRITHAGLLPGLASESIGAFAGESIDAPGYLGRLRVAHACAAVSDRCLLIGRSLFERLGGFDAEAFPDAGADIDLCLRSGDQGYPVVWTPDALLLHANAPVLPSDAREALLQRWLPRIAQAPGYHPALRLDAPGGFCLGESEFSWQPLPWRPLPRVLAHPADAWGSGQYRVLQPLAALKAAGLAEGTAYASLLDPVEQARIDPDVVVLQRRVGDEELEAIRRMPRFSPAFKVYELDDYLPNLPAKSAHREHMPRDILRTLRRAMTLVDRFVVSTPALAEAFAGFHPDIRVARNHLPPAWWAGLPAPRRNRGTKPRVGWAGGLGHTGDLEMIADVVRELAGEIDWVFLGMCPERLRPYVAEFHPGVDIAVYPRVLSRLYLDVAIAPLEQNRFNECKSNLRLLEYGACAIPVVCSDVGPYRDDALPITRVRNRHRDWVGAIRELLADAAGRAATGDALRDVVRRDWMLAGDNLTAWRDAWLPD